MTCTHGAKGSLPSVSSCHGAAMELPWREEGCIFSLRGCLGSGKGEMGSVLSEGALSLCLRSLYLGAP